MQTVWLNSQKPSKIDMESDGSLLIHSLFYTIQGEGPFMGEPAVFIRLAGCNLACPACDTEYTEGSYRARPIDIIVSALEAAVEGRGLSLDHPLVVITGGEPFRQNIQPLVKSLLSYGMKVQIETNGTLYREGILYGHPRLTIVCSPKAPKVNKELEPHISAYKYVIAADQVDTDGLPTSALGLGRPARPLRQETPIFVNPQDDHNELMNAANVIAAKNSALRYGHRLGLQIHKLIGVE